jgi:hypothetical protein
MSLLAVWPDACSLMLQRRLQPCTLHMCGGGERWEQLMQGLPLSVSNSNFIYRHFDLDNVTNMSLLVKVGLHISQKYHFDLCNYKWHA